MYDILRLQGVLLTPGKQPASVDINVEWEDKESCAIAENAQPLV